LGNIIDFRKNDNGLERTEFDFAIVPDAVHCENPVCPHCQSPGEAEVIEAVEAMYFETLGDLMMCLDCDGMFIIVENPFIDYDKPIMTRWSVPEKMYKKK
jgi:hypothetical protein